jgi:arylsulfatase A-like enzyme
MLSLPAAPRPLLLAVLGLASAASCGGEDAENGPRTVALLSLDTVRFDVADYSDPQLTPNLARLAERGTVFERAYSGSSWTLPTHAQMFTGQPPALHGVQDDNVRIDPLTPTLPELFSDAGWATFGAFSGWYLVKDYGFGRGFDAYVNAMPGGAELEREFQRALREDGNSGGTWAAADLQSHRAISSPDVVARLVDGIQLAGDRDLFLFGHFFDPHYDYVPPGEFATRFDPDYAGSLTGEDFYTNKAVWDEARGGRQISERDLEHIVALYRGEIAWTDRNLGELFDALEAEGRLDSAWIAVTADHGEEFFDHGRRGHRQTLFQEQVHVPLLIVPPSGTGGPRRTSASASLTDLAPTLCAAAGLEPVASHAGRSLLGVWRGEALAEKPALHSLMRTVVSNQGIKHRVLDGVTTDGIKLVRELVAKDGALELRSAVAYDLERDPEELAPTRDMSDPRVVAAWGALEAEHARLRALAARLPQSDPAQRSSAAKEMFLSQLEALGYMDDGEAAGRVAPPWGFEPPPAVALDSAREE